MRFRRWFETEEIEVLQLKRYWSALFSRLVRARARVYTGEHMTKSAGGSFCEFRPNRYANRRWRVRDPRDAKDRVTEWPKKTMQTIFASLPLWKNTKATNTTRDRGTHLGFALSNFFSKATSAGNQNHFEKGSLKMLQGRGTRVTIVVISRLAIMKIRCICR